jgi:exodeoxyribonuclease VII large subunit
MIVQEPTFSVADLTAAIGRTLERAFPEDVWVRGEIRDLSRAPSGHVYFSLVDPSADLAGAAPAVLPVTLFASDRDPVNWALRRAGAGRMRDGVEVRIRGRLGHYAPRGTVQLRMTWIDTDYTVGRLAAEKARVRRVLAAEGLLDRNASLPFPPLPQRVGLVTSEGSAAQADFIHELRSSGLGFTVVFADARVQGDEAERSLVAALRRLAVAEVDLVAVVRGGGSQTDLAAFDRETVARAVATMPVPVLAGIGHEVDETLVDLVAARVFKTPTACAVGIVAEVRATLSRLDLLGGRIVAASRSRVSRVERDLRAAAGRLQRGATGGIRRADRDAASAVERLGTAAPATLRRAEGRAVSVGARIATSGRRSAAAAAGHVVARRRRMAATVPRALAAASLRLDVARATVDGHDPARALARGWSLTRTRAGRLVRRVADVARGDIVTTTVADGAFESRVGALPTDNGGANIEGTS